MSSGTCLVCGESAQGFVVPQVEAWKTCSDCLVRYWHAAPRIASIVCHKKKATVAEITGNMVGDGDEVYLQGIKRKTLLCQTQYEFDLVLALHAETEETDATATAAAAAEDAAVQAERASVAAAERDAHRFRKQHLIDGHTYNGKTWGVSCHYGECLPPWKLLQMRVISKQDYGNSLLANSFYCICCCSELKQEYGQELLMSFHDRGDPLDLFYNTCPICDGHNEPDPPQMDDGGVNGYWTGYTAAAAGYTSVTAAAGAYTAAAGDTVSMPPLPTRGDLHFEKECPGSPWLADDAQLAHGLAMDDAQRQPRSGDT